VKYQSDVTGPSEKSLVECDCEPPLLYLDWERTAMGFLSLIRAKDYGDAGVDIEAQEGWRVRRVIGGAMAGG